MKQQERHNRQIDLVRNFVPEAIFSVIYSKYQFKKMLEQYVDFT